MASGRDSQLAIANRRIFRTVVQSFTVDKGAVAAALPRMITPFAQRDYTFTYSLKPETKLPAPTNDFVRQERQHESKKYQRHMYEFPWTYAQREMHMMQNPVEHAGELQSELDVLGQLPANILLLGTNGDHAGTGSATDNISNNTIYGIADHPNGTAGTTARPELAADPILTSAGDYDTSGNLVKDLTKMSIQLHLKKFYGPRGFIFPRPLEPVFWHLFSSLWKTERDWMAQIGQMFFIPQEITGEPSSITGTFYEWLIDLTSVEYWGAPAQMEVFRNPNNKKYSWDIRETIMPKFNFQHDGTEFLKGVVACNADYSD